MAARFQDYCVNDEMHNDENLEELRPNAWKQCLIFFSYRMHATCSSVDLQNKHRSETKEKANLRTKPKTMETKKHKRSQREKKVVKYSLWSRKKAPWIWTPNLVVAVWQSNNVAPGKRVYRTLKVHLTKKTTVAFYTNESKEKNPSLFDSKFCEQHVSKSMMKEKTKRNDPKKKEEECSDF